MRPFFPNEQQIISEYIHQYLESFMVSFPFSVHSDMSILLLFRKRENEDLNFQEMEKKEAIGEIPTHKKDKKKKVYKENFLGRNPLSLCLCHCLLTKKELETSGTNQGILNSEFEFKSWH
ncbi:hypothetical protein NPIL_166211 [Nephila pilipes]|uniref:Uncharacterized protein n=1 Tax=Nephila pilipes TaxID=299642 RepID=A0A8X6MTG3_NEPPI|nr:hypothetical protein NPIL_166211 [Nephila pilipes]